MDSSMEEGDSLFSVPGPSTRPRALYQTPPQPSSGPPQPIGLGYNTSVVPQHLPDMDESFEQPNRWGGGASPPDVSSASYEYAHDREADQSGAVDGGENGEGDGEDEEGSYEASESSSADYDPDADPDRFAQRLNELAGTKEISETERKAISRGLPISGKQKQGPLLPLAEFRTVINHHLEVTKWKYDSNRLSAAMPGRSATHASARTDLAMDMLGDTHPIRVLGGGWTEKDDWLDPPSDGMEVDLGGLAGQDHDQFAN
ncbi:uncharacterized protein I303_101662 [Kwoniella dejecticola CBS 10117]|uniref:Uncharacterized protein n=1 Tax=Kwoniella dejecticola CBS 10117 TaxID=1296121 RepID=A0A1A6AD52_9TREE|nr:uncharacterized protein I303_02201 [Kwoniella dejecticola CBS 10117]OBR87985.1 hypothetical protein I303_02201 [Kwoniella dejecticola CBS 10117]